MPGKDDRDVRRPLTPPAGVRAQTSPPDDEFDPELTPVQGSIENQIHKRATTAAAVSKAAFKAIGEVRQDLQQYAAADSEAHDEMKSGIADVRSDVKSLNTHVSDLREDVAGMSGKMDGLTRVIERDFERDKLTDSDRLNRKRLRLEYTYYTKKEIWKTMLKVGGGVLLALASAAIAWYFAH